LGSRMARARVWPALDAIEMWVVHVGGRSNTAGRQILLGLENCWTSNIAGPRISLDPRPRDCWTSNLVCACGPDHARKRQRAAARFRRVTTPMRDGGHSTHSTRERICHTRPAGKKSVWMPCSPLSLFRRQERRHAACVRCVLRAFFVFRRI
jgi:hypothetical protein